MWSIQLQNSQKLTFKITNDKHVLKGFNTKALWTMIKTGLYTTELSEVCAKLRRMFTEQVSSNAEQIEQHTVMFAHGRLEPPGVKINKGDKI